MTRQPLKDTLDYKLTNVFLGCSLVCIIAMSICGVLVTLCIIIEEFLLLPT